MPNEDTPTKVNSTLTTSPIYDIIWGMYCVPVAKPVQIESTSSPLYSSSDIYFCRSLVKFQEFPFQAFSSEILTYDQLNSTNNPQLRPKTEVCHISGIINKESVDLIRVLALLSGSTPCAANSSQQSIYLKEFIISELESLPAQLRAEALRIHTNNDKFTPTWYQEHPPFSLDSLNPMEEKNDRLSRDSTRSRDSEIFRASSRDRLISISQLRPRSLSRSRAGSFSRKDSESSLIERLTFSLRSMFENDNENSKTQNTQDLVKLNSPCGCGLLWESKALHKVFYFLFPFPSFPYYYYY